MNSSTIDHDLAKSDGLGFSLDQLNTLLSDVDHQPNGWRDIAQIACDYYDGNQLSPEVKATLEERGQPVIITNLVAPTIDAVLGMEVRTRTDLMLVADDDEGEPLKDALQQKFKDTWRLARADRANADAYASQIKAGIGWVEVTRNSDPFSGGKYNVKTVRRQEMWWDWHAEEADLSDARWIMRKKWVDIDEMCSIVPQYEQVIRHMANGWAEFINVDSYEESDSMLMDAYGQYDSWSRKDVEWLDTRRGRIILQVIYYKTFRRGHVLDLPNGRTVEYDPQNIVHQTALKMGKASVRVATWQSIREAWFVGHFRIVDRPSVAPNGYFPIVPFIGYRKDRTGEPYGLAYRMISQQDEINARRMKLTWLLQAKRVVADDDATDMSRDEVMEEVERPDGYIRLNKDRRNKKSISESFQVQQDFNVASQQFQVMQDAMRNIQDVAGVYNAMMGQDSNATSGVAINSLVEQGATTLAEINDNYHYSRTRVADLVMAYLIEDLAKQSNIKITVHKEDVHKRKQVVLNATNESGGKDNDVKRWKGHITQAPVQSTPSYRQAMAQEMTRIVGQLPPQVQLSVLDMVVELMEIPNKQEFLNRLRSALNIPKDQEDMTEEELAAATAEQQKQQAIEDINFKSMELGLAEQQAKVAEVNAKAQEIQSRADELQRKIESQDVIDEKTEAETDKILHDMRALNAQAAATRKSVMQDIDSQIAAIQV